MAEIKQEWAYKWRAYRMGLFCQFKDGYASMEECMVDAQEVLVDPRFGYDRVEVTAYGILTA